MPKNHDDQKPVKKPHRGSKPGAEGRPTPHAPTQTSFHEHLRVGEGFRLSAVDPESTPGFNGKQAEARALMAEVDVEADELQERLYAESRKGGRRAILLIVQGMDTAGKGGIMRHVVGTLDPQGVHYHAFKAPTAEERAHPFLWRIQRQLPEPGLVGVFDRSQYEDVLIGRVRQLAPPEELERRYGEINHFEATVADAGTTLVKVMLHISKDEQRKRLSVRLSRPDKYWKHDPADIAERAHWDAYMEAYQLALERCSTEVAPWFVVPANHKWYAQLAVQQLLIEHLRRLDPQWPPPDFDVEAERARLAAT